MYAALVNQEQKRGSDSVSRITDAQNFAALKVIGGVSGNQKQKNPWKKLRQPYQAQIEGAVSDVINLPSDGDGLHLDCGDDKKAGNLKQDEIGMGKSNASGFGVGGWRHEYSNLP